MNTVRSARFANPVPVNTEAALHVRVAEERKRVWRD